ncbi:winged helix-turn-helix domain-containing protein, partial [Streptomyces sp. NRRL F-3273]
MAGTTPGTPRVLRAMNDRAALDLLVAQGPLTRTRIGELTGLSKPTASQLLARLEDAGLVRSTGSQG